MTQALKKPGFTLVELLVVVAVVAVLACLLLPALKKAQAAGKTAQCANNLHQVYLAEAGYAGDFDGWIGANCRSNAAGSSWHTFLTGGPDDSTTSAPALNRYPYPALPAGPYIETHKVANADRISEALFCPSMLYGVNNVFYGTYYGIFSDFFDDDNSGPNYKSGYVLLMDTVPTDFFFRTPQSIPNPYPASYDAVSKAGRTWGVAKVVSMARAVNPGQVPMFGDSVSKNNNGELAGQKEELDLGTNTGGGTNFKRFHLRHNGVGSLLFWDGHEERLGPNEAMSRGLTHFVTQNGAEL